MVISEFMIPDLTENISISKILDQNSDFSFAQNRKLALEFARQFTTFIKNLPQSYLLTEKQRTNLASIMQKSHTVPRIMMWQALQCHPSIILSLGDQIIKIMIDTILETMDCPEDCEMLKTYLYIEQKEQKEEWLKQNGFMD